jgi:D-hydroxyproline dehydrogenase subunit alpha
VADPIHADVTVIGGGPAGIAAATVAAENGANVLLIDDSPRPGGQIWRHVSRHTLGSEAKQWLHRLERSGAQVLSSTAVVDVTGDAEAGFILRAHGSSDHLVHSAAVIIAAGARELFLPFPGWTVPGVTGVGGGQALLKAGASVAGRRVVVAGSGPLLLPVAAAISAAGGTVTHILEQAPAHRVLRFAFGLWRSPARLAEAAVYRRRALRARYRTGTWVSVAEGGDRVRSVMITNGRRTWNVRCDMLCVGYGLVPSVELAQLAGCEMTNGTIDSNVAQATCVPGVYVAGESAGVAGVRAALAEGEIAAHCARDFLSGAASSTGREGRAATIRRLRASADAERSQARRMDAAFALRPELRQLATPDTIVCRCEDVNLGAIARCESMREAKLHTRAGMGACQGRVCGPALGLLFNWSQNSGRPPALPVPVSTLMMDITAVAGGEI